MTGMTIVIHEDWHIWGVAALWFYDFMVYGTMGICFWRWLDNYYCTVLSSFCHIQLVRCGWSSTCMRW
ncbi:uncharacterized protein BO95DRAFT_68044 [Aspergillus brunneoviolaceus CBS 621.78]|uniref:Uncharacterized protein n=1 Tax=Aspergillus brunneoviolaceus CBS 621.78 TaxID=1450534 RepID=A0ACD1GFT6_9EURO|nr:hypothetical protein BO95DRAFT_68044 [Aspergillus brunneoviolaceus CBS 621.78]RAH48092.1 hypothetical protein BO95DRAFT_68044 [Aspergillus brunneoviolaceus CBS 621.78]